MITISLCMIVKNEQTHLSRCLESVAGAVDEIIIVDTGSTDDTKAIARRFTDKIFDFNWNDNFSDARNYAFSFASMDYIIWLDADDVLPERERIKLIELRRTMDGHADAVMMPYYTHFDEQGNPLLTSRRERLVKRECGFRWQEPVHEYIAIYGNIAESDVTVYHRKESGYTDRNIRIYEAILGRGEALSSRGSYYYARELYDHARYEEAAVGLLAFLDGGEGWVEDNIEACLLLGRCCRILGQGEKCLSALLRSFMYDNPRHEGCCEIGYYYRSLGDDRRAVFWFELASNLGRPSGYGFIHNDYLGYIPNIELCVCHSNLGNNAVAEFYNERAAVYKPNDPAVKHNRAYFAVTKKAQKNSI